MSTYIRAHDTKAAEKLGLEIYKLAETSNTQSESPSIAIICIGTDRATGDSLGPLAGELIGAKLRSGALGKKVQLLGTLEKPVHALNIREEVRRINKAAKPLIIAIDACLGDACRVGYLNAGKGSVCPGAALNKDLPHVGDIFVTGVVNSSIGDGGQLLLQSTRLNLVMKMARTIAAGVWFAVRMITWSQEAE